MFCPFGQPHILVMFGRRVYSSGSFGLRVANYIAIIPQYDFALWAAMILILHSLPEEQKEAVKNLGMKSHILARLSLRAACESSDSRTRTMVTGVVS